MGQQKLRTISEKREAVEGVDCRGRKGEEKLEFLGTPRVGDQLEKMVQKGLLKVCERKVSGERKF